MRNQELQAQLQEALNNAVDNGFDMLAMSDDEIADDIKEFCAPLEDVPRAELLPLIATWRSDKAAE